MRATTSDYWHGCTTGTAHSGHQHSVAAPHTPGGRTPHSPAPGYEGYLPGLLNELQRPLLRTQARVHLGAQKTSTNQRRLHRLSGFADRDASPSSSPYERPLPCSDRPPLTTPPRPLTTPPRPSNTPPHPNQPTSRYHCREVKASSGASEKGSASNRVTPGGTWLGGYRAQRLRPAQEQDTAGAQTGTVGPCATVDQATIDL